MWDPFEEMERFRRNLDRLFKDFYRPLNIEFKELMKNFNEPRSSITTEGNNVVVKASLPGVKREDIMINSTKDLLEIRAKMKKELRKKDKKSYTYHKESKGYYRAMALPVEVDVSKVKSEFKNNVLIVKLPKLKKKKAKKVKVK